jgi:hypothetical protein
LQTDGDAEIVGWVGGIAAAGAERVMDRFGMRRTWAYARLKALIGDGPVVPTGCCCTASPGSMSRRRRGSGGAVSGDSVFTVSAPADSSTPGSSRQQPGEPVDELLRRIGHNGSTGMKLFAGAVRFRS